jgi:hypothetical protein
MFEEAPDISDTWSITWEEFPDDTPLAWIQALPDNPVAPVYEAEANSRVVQTWLPVKLVLHRFPIVINPPLPWVVPDENPLKELELVAPSKDDIRVLLSSTAAFTAVKFAFMSEALVAVPEVKELGTVSADAKVCEEAMTTAIVSAIVSFRLWLLLTICLYSIDLLPIYYLRLSHLTMNRHPTHCCPKLY